MQIVQDELGYGTMVSYENHVGDEYATAETEALGDFYGVSGIPDVRIGGKIAVIGGGGGCVAMADKYRPKILSLLAETDGLSPIAIGSSMSIVGSTATLTATYTLVDPVELTNLRATLLLYEDDVAGGQWDHVTRKIYHQNISFTGQGDAVQVQAAFPIAGYVADNLHGVAYVQQTTGSKDVFQAQKIGFGAPLDFSLYAPKKIASLPDGSGTVTFDLQVMNLLPSADTYTLEPTGFAGSTVDYLVCGDNTPHSGPYDITLGPGEICNMSMRVHTDDVVALQTGAFEVTSHTTLRTSAINFRLFNGSPSILLVDDDSYNADEVPLVNAMNANNLLHEKWDIMNVYGGASPGYSNMAPYDIVIWHTAWRFNNLLTTADMDALTQFMNNGGNLFLTSQEFLDTMGGVPNAFITNCLGVSDWELDKGYVQLYGVAGDPIGDGLDLPLSIPYPSFKQGDHIIPGGASVSLTAPGGWNATVRYQMPDDGAKSVFMASAFNAIDQDDPDPNNTKVVLGRIIDYLWPESPAAVEDLGGSLARSRITGVQPNPFNPRTEISILLSSAAAGPVRLELFDPSGRRVASLFDGSLAAGEHHFTWDGSSAWGKPADSGIYFARLRTVEGKQSHKLVLLK